MSSTAISNIENDPIIKPATTNDGGEITAGRANLKNWLGKPFRVVITDGRILYGLFNCTDKDSNMVLTMSDEFLEEGQEARHLGSVMIPGKHIVSVSVDSNS